MHTVYKALLPEEVERIITYCRDHTISNGGIFEIYTGSKESEKMVLVNSSRENESLKQFQPMGIFYCNYFGPGIISLEEEDPDHDSMPSARNHIQVIKQTIDTLIKHGYPGANIFFDDFQQN